jgi:hypothetical protein
MLLILIRCAPAGDNLHIQLRQHVVKVGVRCTNDGRARRTPINNGRLQLLLLMVAPAHCAPADDWRSLCAPANNERLLLMVALNRCAHATDNGLLQLLLLVVVLARCAPVDDGWALCAPADGGRLLLMATSARRAHTDDRQLQLQQLLGVVLVCYAPADANLHVQLRQNAVKVGVRYAPANDGQVRHAPTQRWAAAVAAADAGTHPPRSLQ